MGYYTKFSLESRGKYSIGKVVGELTCNGFYDVSDTGYFYDSVKWYDHEDDMRALSRKFPENVFALRGIGENEGDDWIKYFKNGKMHTYKITEADLFQYYDEDTLK